MDSNSNPEARQEDNAGTVDEAPRTKRRRKSGWDAPAPVPVPNATVATAQAAIPTSAAASIPSYVTPMAVLAAPVAAAAIVPPAIDPAAAQRLAFEKAQQILASSGLNLNVAVGGTSSASTKSLENRIYVGSLNYSVTEVEIRAIFGSIGPIRSIDMSFDAVTQRSKGFCFVDFENASDAYAAMGMNGVEIAGRAMKVGRPQGGPNGLPLASNVATLQMQAALLAAARTGGTSSSTTAAPPTVASLPTIDASKTTVILDDMVPLAEASDPGLKGEIEEEATTYGALKDISIEVIENRFVRIKLFYVDATSAIKAYKAMNGRYFGGTVIKASLSS